MAPTRETALRTCPARHLLGEFAASVAREPLSAFVIGITLLFFLLLLGWDVFGRFLNSYIDNFFIEIDKSIQLGFNFELDRVNLF